MGTLVPIPAEQRKVYHDALLAGRAEAERLGYGLMDDRIFAAFHRALYRPMLDAHGERIARAIEVARGDRCPECGGQAAFRRVDGPRIGCGCGAGHVWQLPDRPWLDYDPAAIARQASGSNEGAQS